MMERDTSRRLRTCASRIVLATSLLLVGTGIGHNALKNTTLRPNSWNWQIRSTISHHSKQLLFARLLTHYRDGSGQEHLSRPCLATDAFASVWGMAPA